MNRKGSANDPENLRMNQAPRPLFTSDLGFSPKNLRTEAGSNVYLAVGINKCTPC